MNNKILILSRCQKRKKSSNDKRFAFLFHFKGAYKGEKVEQIIFDNLTQDAFIVGENYLLWAECREVKKGNLFCFFIKIKKI